MIAGGSLEMGATADETAWREAEGRMISDFLVSQDLDPLERRWPFRG